MRKKWEPEVDACDGCQDCKSFLNELENCQGSETICHEYIPNLTSAPKTEVSG